MNAEEKQALKDRIARAERLENQIRNLKDGIAKLRSGECARVSIPVLASDTAWERPEDTLTWVEACLALLARVRELEEALRPFADFAERLDAKPPRGIDDELYSIHGGESCADHGGASLKASDCRRAAALLRAGSSTQTAARPRGEG